MIASALAMPWPCLSLSLLPLVSTPSPVPGIPTLLAIAHIPQSSGSLPLCGNSCVNGANCALQWASKRLNPKTHSTGISRRVFNRRTFSFSLEAFLFHTSPSRLVHTFRNTQTDTSFLQPSLHTQQLSHDLLPECVIHPHSPSLSK